jgi:hypothetical protein
MLFTRVEIVRAITSAKAGAVASSKSFQFSFRKVFTCSPETGDYIELLAMYQRLPMSDTEKEL